MDHFWYCGCQCYHYDLLHGPDTGDFDLFVVELHGVDRNIVLLDYSLLCYGRRHQEDLRF